MSKRCVCVRKGEYKEKKGERAIVEREKKK